jgi:hypothetical protein
VRVLEANSEMRSQLGTRAQLNLALHRLGVELELRLATGWTAKESGFKSRQGYEFSLPHVVQTGSGVHPASYPMGAGGILPKG